MLLPSIRSPSKGDNTSQLTLCSYCGLLCCLLVVLSEGVTRYKGAAVSSVMTSIQYDRRLRRLRDWQSVKTQEVGKPRHPIIAFLHSLR